MAKITHKIYYQGSPIGSEAALSKTLDTSDINLKRIASSIPDHYNLFEKQVKTKIRLLSEPTRDLKIIQKRIITRIFTNIKFPHYLHGGIKSDPSRDFVTNANSHSGAEAAIALDFKNFFPSITFNQVENVFKLLFHFPPPVAKLLASLTTLNDQLPQGAPTSSYISNLIMFEREYKLASKFESKGLVYTRLIDDITVSSKKTFSEKDKNEIVKDIYGMAKFYNFEIHPTKKYFFTRKNPHQLMTVTGLWLNRGSPKISTNTRNQIAFEVMALNKDAATLGRYSTQYHDNYNSVSGKVALLSRMKHHEANRMRSILASIMPIYDKSGEAKISKMVTSFHKKTQNQKSFGYIKAFYRLQNSIFILKRTNKGLGNSLQAMINKKMPSTTLREING